MIFDENNPIKIVLADDHEIVRAGMKRFLALDKSIKVLDEANNGKIAVDLVMYHKPDLAILDIMMPIMTGIEATKLIKKNSGNTLVCMLTAFEDSKHIEAAIEAGADGYLTKDVSPSELIKSIHTLILGERVFSKSLVSLVQNKYIPSQRENASITITKREQNILNLVALGKKSSEIAEELQISIRTVESHRYNLMQKFGVNNVAGLIRYALINQT